MMMEIKKDAVFVPDQWDSVFEDIEREQDEKEEREKQEKEAEETRIIQAGIKLLETIEDLLKKGLRYEMSREFKVLLGKKPESFCKGSPETDQMLIRCAKEPYFRDQFRELCESYVIDRKTYKIFLKRLYPRGSSDALVNMRTWLKDRMDQAPNCLKENPNYPFLTIILLLVFGYQIFKGTPPLYAVFPTFLVGVHYALYRLLYPKCGGAGSQVRISMGIMLALFLYGERIPLGGKALEGIIMMTTTYMNLWFTCGLIYLPELFGRSARKKDRERIFKNRHMNKERIY